MLTLQVLPLPHEAHEGRGPPLRQHLHPLQVQLQQQQHTVSTRS